jgi:multiple antibiotic resistance protein
MIDISAIGLFATALFTITNPVGNTAIFAGLTSSMATAEQRATARQSAVAITIALLVCLWIGTYLLRLFGIDIPSLETAGGIIVLGLGLSMLQNQKSRQSHSSEESAATLDKASIAVVPIAIPIVAGPGAITVTLVAVGKLHGEWATLIGMSGVCLAFGLLFWLCFHFAGHITTRIGVHGIAIVTRVMGIVLAAVACGMIASGLKTLLPGLA